MARKVAEVMNREMVSAREDTSAASIRDLVLAMGITAVPVLDGDGRPVGVLSLRDLVASGNELPRPSGPVAVVKATESLEAAGETLARTDYHHLVVVDDSGRAIGMVSAVDLLRGLLGVPARHPAAFPHLDRELNVSWTDDDLLDADHLGAAAEGAGVIVLLRGGRGVAETPVWVESCARVRMRLEELLNIPQDDTPALAAVLQHGHLRFRAAAVADPARRDRVVAVLHERIDHQALPQQVGG